MEDIRTLIAQVDLDGLKQLLSRHPEMANAGIALGSQDATPAHPLHRICDGVHLRIYTDEQARDMAHIFVGFGANVDGVTLVENKDSPLTAAASLYADLTALYYIDEGATIDHPGCHGGTALHWAAWCGRDAVVRKLIESGAPLEKRCKDFRSTPLFWAIHGYKFGGINNRFHQERCAALLIDAGAVKDTRNAEGTHVLELLGPEDGTLKSLLS
jgi:ankyrin repeat protein